MGLGSSEVRDSFGKGGGGRGLEEGGEESGGGGREGGKGLADPGRVHLIGLVERDIYAVVIK